LIDSNQQWIYGIDLINKMRKNADLKSIVVFTAKDNDKNKSDGLNLNFAGHMHKPTDSDKSDDLFSPVQLLDCY
jgi:DNA-binding response OmpR family regulator